MTATKGAISLDPGAARDLDAVAESALDPDRLAYYRIYFADFFHGAFVLGMGTEHILDTLADSGAGGDWLDLGSGPCTLFWSLALTGVRSIRSVDAAPEALHVLREFAASTRVPDSHEQVMARHGRDPGHLAHMRAKLAGCHVFDAMRPWPAEFAGRRFDLVTEFGLFGLAPTVDGYRDCFRYLRPHVRPGARVVGADWIRSARFIADEGHDNTYLTEELVAAAIRDAGLRPRSGKLCPIKGDDWYDALIVWSADAPADRTGRNPA